MKLFNGDTNKLKQTILLKKALHEVNIDPTKCELVIDHDYAFAIVNDLRLPIIFPNSFFNFAEQYHTISKKYMFYFNGHPGKDYLRKKLLEKFIARPDSRIIFTNDGRRIEKKGEINEDYYKEMAESHFGLAPHQPHWRGDRNALWTYRYIECLMLKTMPVQFRSTPLTTEFIGDSIFKWDDDNFSDFPTYKELNQNYKFAKSKFSLSKKQIEKINRKFYTV